MKSSPIDPKMSKMPSYTIAQLMNLLDLREPAVRRMIKKAGIGIDESLNDPDETICYEDFRILWLSVANRYEGKLLATLLIEKHENWYSKLFNRGR